MSMARLRGLSAPTSCARHSLYARTPGREAADVDVKHPTRLIAVKRELDLELN
jgi:hypothetical protein